jgi:hypothetical protein
MTFACSMQIQAASRYSLQAHTFNGQIQYEYLGGISDVVIVQPLE